MFQPPDPANSYDYENNFYLTCAPGRLGKALAHYELYRMALHRPGVIAECGVFKGASFCRFASLRALLESADARQLIGFDVFSTFPQTDYEPDRARRESFISSAGAESISQDDLRRTLAHKGCDRNVELIAGDICETVPRFFKDHPETRVAFLNLDVDIYEPNVTVLEHFWPRLSRGGVLVLDDYGFFPALQKPSMTISAINRSPSQDSHTPLPRHTLSSRNLPRLVHGHSRPLVRPTPRPAPASAPAPACRVRRARSRRRQRQRAFAVRDHDQRAIAGRTRPARRGSAARFRRRSGWWPRRASGFRRSAETRGPARSAAAGRRSVAGRSGRRSCGSRSGKPR